MASAYPWKFFRAGGVDQVVLANADDLRNLGALDQKLWAALACPSKGLELDERTLALLDSDANGRIRPPEVLAAVAWLDGALRDLGEVFEPSDELPLDSIAKDKPVGKEVLAGAKLILESLGKGDANTISLADVSSIESILAAKLHADWLEAGRVVASRLLGDDTAGAAEALEAVRAKVDDYFARCRLAAFDARAAAALNATEAELQALGPYVLSAETEDAARLPLAKVDAGRPLPLEGGVNPAWAARVAAFARATVAPVVGARASLNEADWAAIKQRLVPYAEWMAAKPVTERALAPQASQIESAEKLIRFRRDFVRFLRNFVNFAEFYGARTSIFQTGTLYIDARSCTLCLAVEDAGRHALLAGQSQAYLVYCDCVRRADQTKRTIVAAVTGGDTDNLMVGRNGVLYDRAGDDWDATITKIVENPISVRQAFWLPYKRFVRLVEEQFAKRAKAADDESHKKLDAMATETAAMGAADDKEKAKEATAPAAKPKGIDVGTVAAIGVAVGGIATFFSSILATFLGLGMWMPAGLLALVLAISGPSMLLAWLKLRQRNIGPILDANGWAVNTMARVNVPFGGALTALAALPPGASRSLRDPFAEKRAPWKTYLFLLVVLALAALWALGKLDAYLPDKLGARAVLHLPPPAAAPASAK